TGPSYLGATQLLAAAQAPPALRAITPSVAYGPEAMYQGGAFKLGFGLAWSTGMAVAQLQRNNTCVGTGDGSRERLEAITADLWTAYRRLPLLDLASITPWLDSTYGEWLRHPEGDDYWRATAAEERCAQFKTPALHITGWYDLFLTGSLA